MQLGVTVLHLGYGTVPNYLSHVITTHFTFIAQGYLSFRHLSGLPGDKVFRNASLLLEMLTVKQGCGVGVGVARSRGNDAGFMESESESEPTESVTMIKNSGRSRSRSRSRRSATTTPQPCR